VADAEKAAAAAYLAKETAGVAPGAA